MSSLNKLRHDIDTTKRELKNIRQEVIKQRANMKSETEKIKSFFGEVAEVVTPNEEKFVYAMTPIGYISSCFKFKNGIPRQPSLCPTAKGTLKIEKSVFTNPEHSIIGLEDFSHVWILFVFHENGQNAVKAKVHPPRLNGATLGVFSTRSPHRPSPIGLSLTKLDKIEGDTLFLSGIDLLDGTPVIDIKPYIPMYDTPIVVTEASDSQVPSSDICTSNDAESTCEGEELNENTNSRDGGSDLLFRDCKVPNFLKESPEKLEVVFTNRALIDLDTLQSSTGCDSQKELFSSKQGHSKVKQSIIEVLQNDPRSIYRREKCSDRLYYFYINDFHVTCWFDDLIAEVLRVKLASTASL